MAKHHSQPAHKPGFICLLIVPHYKPGDPCPEGYLNRAEWARVQLAAGLRQKKCPMCGLWRFPQEKCCEVTKRV